MHHGQLPRKATIGDIVTARGYEGKYFRVNSYSEQFHTEPGVSYNEVIYDLTDINDYMNYIVADDEDITVIAESTVIAPIDYAEVTQVTKKPKVKTKQAVIDGLLDELITMQTVIDICGTDADYAVRIDDVKRKLKEVAE